MIDSKKLPNTLRRDPDIMTARLDTHQSQIENHAARITHLEQDRHGMVETPVGKFPLHIVLIVLFGLIAWRPDIAAKWIGQ
jgi:hypothetical protein